ncbi:MAG TPA: protein-glutamate O-methyltransferase CheR [Bacillales bacterium]|nr:protein-glutamate O-methyltransferase CheR [Bacillales bacterium]
MTDDYEWFVRRITALHGIDLSMYKEMQMKRRLSALRDQHGYADFHAFHEAIMADADLLKVFLDKITINVSSFYRNMKRWTVFEKNVLPRLLKGRDRLNVWSAACSTGEEPYTLAMILSKRLPQGKVTILATDMDEQALKKAKSGQYSERSLQELPAEIKLEFFEKKEHSWVIDEKIKRWVHFERHNLLTDPFPGGLDLVVCRNVLIYFTNEAKSGLYGKFNESLSPGGILFVGSTEQIFDPEQYGFHSDETFFYRKTGNARLERQRSFE